MTDREYITEESELMSVVKTYNKLIKGTYQMVINPTTINRYKSADQDLINEFNLELHNSELIDLKVGASYARFILTSSCPIFCGFYTGGRDEAHYVDTYPYCLHKTLVTMRNMDSEYVTLYWDESSATLADCYTKVLNMYYNPNYRQSNVITSPFVGPHAGDYTQDTDERRMQIAFDLWLTNKRYQQWREGNQFEIPLMPAEEEEEEDFTEEEFPATPGLYMQYYGGHSYYVPENHAIDKDVSAHLWKIYPFLYRKVIAIVRVSKPTWKYILGHLSQIDPSSYVLGFDISSLATSSLVTSATRFIYPSMPFVSYTKNVEYELLTKSDLNGLDWHYHRVRGHTVGKPWLRSITDQHEIRMPTYSEFKKFFIDFKLTESEVLNRDKYWLEFKKEMGW